MESGSGRCEASSTLLRTSPSTPSLQVATTSARCSVDSAGSGAGLGYSINVPWDLKASRSGPGDAEYAAAFTQILLPIAHDFAPELVLISAGFDAAGK